ncbi:MAG TPA: hypothetical protein GX715_06480 [Armatimonadetes bacterium]|nr:hypothetical protein [Armatimonadota bacterium]
MNRRKAAALPLGVIGLALLAIAVLPGQTRRATAQEDWFSPEPEEIRVTARAQSIAGQPTGEVLLGETVVTRIRSAAGGKTAPERAEIAAARLSGALSTGNPTPEEFRVAQMNDQYVVAVRDELIVTADTYHAKVNGTTPVQLATQWRDNLAQAYRRELDRPIGKICPIVSVGKGTRLGLAHITGPRAQVHKAAFVGQLETTFQKNIRIRIFVPIKAQDGVDRVPQVNVNAYADLKM